MEHLTLTPGMGSVREYTADAGYKIVSKRTGREYTQVCTADITQFDVVQVGETAPKTGAKKRSKPATRN